MQRFGSESEGSFVKGVFGRLKDRASDVFRSYQGSSSVIQRGASGQTAEERISANTYPDLSHLATELYMRLQEEITELEEPINFGETTLDVGSRDGRYVQVIRELGPRRITAIDPSADELQKGVDHGYVKPEEALPRTLEQFAEGSKRQVDSAFVFNVNPDLPRSPQFIDALMSSVKPGGIVVTSFVEFDTSVAFGANTYSLGKLKTIRRKKKEREKRESREKIDQDGEPIYFISIGRRTTR